MRWTLPPLRGALCFCALLQWFPLARASSDPPPSPPAAAPAAAACTPDSHGNVDPKCKASAPAAACTPDSHGNVDPNCKASAPATVCTPDSHGNVDPNCKAGAAAEAACTPDARGNVDPKCLPPTPTPTPVKIITTPAVSPTPIPKHLFLPVPQPLRAPLSDEEDEGEDDVPWKKARYTLVVLMASWNPDSLTLTAWLNQQKKEWDKRRIQVLAFLSGDTAVQKKRFEALAQPEFPLQIIQPEWYDSVKTPSIPTLWMVDRNGEVLWMRELPKKPDLQKLQDALLKLTGF